MMWGLILHRLVKTANKPARTSSFLRFGSRYRFRWVPCYHFLEPCCLPAWLELVLAGHSCPNLTLALCKSLHESEMLIYSFTSKVWCCKEVGKAYLPCFCVFVCVLFACFCFSEVWKTDLNHILSAPQRGSPSALELR